MKDVQRLIRRVRWPQIDPNLSQPEDLWGKPEHRLALLIHCQRMEDTLDLTLPEGSVTLFLNEAIGQDQGGPVGVLVDIVTAAKALSSQSYAAIQDAVKTHAARRNWLGATAQLFVTESQILLAEHKQSTVAMVRKPVLIVDPPRPQYPFEIRPVRPKDEDKCLDMIAAALTIGTAWRTGQPCDPKRMRKIARSVLNETREEGGLHLVATLNAKVVGHAIGFISQDCIRTGVCDGRLLDTFTHGDFRNLGLAALLTDVWEYELGLLGGTSFRGTVSGPNQAPILKNLDALGWREYAREWPFLLN